jgi:hypothetical protein
MAAIARFTRFIPDSENSSLCRYVIASQARYDLTGDRGNNWQVFARKLTKPFAAATAENLENEHRAITKLSQYRCEHVIAVLGLGTFPDSNIYFIDMELCDINLD